MINIDDLIGVPYVSGGRSIETGFDCYGLAIEVSRRYGHILPDFEETRVTNYQFETCQKICLTLTDKLIPVDTVRKEGDIILFKDSNGVMFHIGVYMGDNRYIHCTKLRVHIGKIDRNTMIGGVYTWQ